MAQNKKMSKKDLDGYRDLLISKRKTLAGTLNHLQTDMDGNDTGRNSASGDPADMGSETFEQDFALSLMESEGNVMQKIEDALVRIDEGTFGQCMECSKWILKARLKAIPWTYYCIECQKKTEAS